jgi:hypothetical protein
MSGKILVFFTNDVCLPQILYKPDKGIAWGAPDCSFNELHR